jgi:hypothetical protein
MNLNIRNQPSDRVKPNLDCSWVATLHQRLQQASAPKEEVTDVYFLASHFFRLHSFIYSSFLYFFDYLFSLFFFFYFLFLFLSFLFFFSFIYSVFVVTYFVACANTSIGKIGGKKRKD